MFAPFEVVDEAANKMIAAYQISSFGQIQKCCEHIPYNSTKKDLYEKTGRESIEAFHYEFRIPGQSTSYKVMWDYNIGLVRMTPFFKCLGYGKTKPSQMLDKNPGLRGLCPSITGGSVGAQGYWMPYRCARAICATFCYEIAGALIPLFGPDFPSECTPPRSLGFADMVISQNLVQEAAVEAEISRDAYRARNATASREPSNTPRLGNYRAGHNEDLHSYFRPSLQSMSVRPQAEIIAGAYRSAQHWEATSHNEVEAWRKRLQENNASAPSLVDLTDRESCSSQQPSYGCDSTRPIRISAIPGFAQDYSGLKRPRPDHDRSDEIRAGARPKSGRLLMRAVLHEDGAQEVGDHEDEDQEFSEKWRVPPAREAEYAAAEVLVRLQKEEQEPAPAPASMITGCSPPSTA